MATHQHHTRRFVALALVAALVAASCGGDDDAERDASETTVPVGDPSAETTAPTDDAPSEPPASSDDERRGGRLVVATADEATLGLEPWTAVTGAGGASVATAIYDTLAAFDSNGDAVPFLAESFETNDDATEWLVTLRPGITFHDGTDLTSEAIVFAFESAREGGRIIQEGFVVEEVDELTARFTFLQPFASFPSSLATQWAWIPSPTAVRELGEDFRNRPVGTGPYRFEEWVRDDHIVLVRNDDYWRDDVAFLDEIEFRPIIDDSVRRAALLAGDVDAIVVGQADIADLRDAAGVELFEAIAGTNAIIFNMTDPLFEDERVRRALAHAVDVDAVIESVYDGVGTPATGPLPHDNPFYMEVETPTYDPDLAASLIEEYESETGEQVAFEFLFSNSPIDQELAQFLQFYWQEVGADVTLGPPLNSGDLQTRRVERQFDVVVGGMPPVLDPDVWLPLFRSDSFLNYSGLVDDELDAAIDDGRAHVDPDDRADAYGRLQQRLTDVLPWFFIRESVVAVAAQPHVGGLDEWPLPDGSAGLSKQFWLPYTADALWIRSDAG